MISNTTKYALRALIFLSLDENKDRKVGIREIAERLQIPMPFLGKILQSLAKKKILKSLKGPNGGFYLAHKPKDIKLIHVIEIIEGDDYFNECLLSNRLCSEHKQLCGLHHGFDSIRKQLKDLFEKKSLEDIKKDINNSKFNLFL